MATLKVDIHSHVTSPDIIGKAGKYGPERTVDDEGRVTFRMAGANHMQRRGWKAGVGFGRHRISSIVFFYMKCPAGGEIEYAADGDYLDDDWQPKLWNPAYGNVHWLGEVKEDAAKPAPDVVPLPQPWPKFG